jgi:hypothetical protein
MKSNEVASPIGKGWLIYRDFVVVGWMQSLMLVTLSQRGAAQPMRKC